MTSGLLAVLGLTCKLNQLWAGTSTSVAQGKGSIWSRFNTASCWWQCQQLGGQFLANKAKQLCERNIWTSGGLRTHCLHKLSLHSGSALAALWSAVLPFSARFARLAPFMEAPIWRRIEWLGSSQTCFLWGSNPTWSQMLQLTSFLFPLQTHFGRNEKEMPGELEGDWLPNYTVNCCSFQQRITRLTNLEGKWWGAARLGPPILWKPMVAHGITMLILFSVKISNYSRLREANPAIFDSQLPDMHVRHQHHSVFVSMGCCTSEPLAC